MIPKCSNLVQGMTFGYPRNDVVLGLKGQRSVIELAYSNTAWVQTLWVPSGFSVSSELLLSFIAVSDSYNNDYELANPGSHGEWP